MNDKCMNNLHADTQNYTICRLQLRLKRLNTQLNEPTNQNFILFQNLLSRHMRKRSFKTLGTTVIRV